MGSGRWDPKAYAAFSSSTTGRSTADIYGKAHTRVASGLSGLSKDLDPKGVKVRESRDSDLNPVSNAIIVGLDVTGSMGMIADVLARQGLGTLFEEILNRKPVTDPHLMFMGIGDAACDQAPLQVSQFEADKRIIDQLVDIYLEHGGGGNDHESYNFPWYFAAMHTSLDCVEKRNKKGYLFTVGDEEIPSPLLKQHIEHIIGDTPERDFSNEELLQMAGRMYHIFHVIVEEGNYARSHGNRVRSAWTSLLGQRAIPLADHTKLSEVIVSAIEVTEGRDVDAVASSWSGNTAVVVANAIKGLPAKTGGTSAGVSKL